MEGRFTRARNLTATDTGLVFACSLLLDEGPLTELGAVAARRAAAAAILAGKGQNRELRRPISDEIRDWPVE